MARALVGEQPDAKVVRAGAAATALGFWFVSLAPVIVASAELHGIVIAFWRSWIGFLMFGAVVVARRQLSWSVIWRCAPAGICFGASVGLFFWASQLTSIANASLLTTLQPVVLLIAGVIIFAERITGTDLFWAGVAIAGAIVLVLAGGSEGTGDLKGDVLATASVIIGAGYFIFGKRVLVTVGITSFMAGMFIWAGVLLSIAGVISGESFVASTQGDWVRVFAVAFGSGLGHYLLNYAQNKASLNLMGVIQLLVPVNATLLAFLFLDQSVRAFQVIGMALVISALSIQTVRRSR